MGMTRHNFRPIALLGIAGIVALSLLGCAPEAEEVACSDQPLGEADASITVLADATSPALQRTLDLLVEDPAKAFGAAAIGLDSRPGIVTLATFDAAGQVHEHGSFNLGGVGRDRARRDRNADEQAECLAAAAEQFVAAAATSEAPANLLRALPTAAELAAARGNKRSAVVIHGFGRTDNDGFVVAETDFATPEARATVLATLNQVDVVPDLSRYDLSVVFVAPSEGVTSAVGAAAITTFVGELCPTLNATSCTAVEVLS